MKIINQVNKMLLLVMGVTVTTAAIASSVTLPNTFVSGEAAVAADVNDNFSAVKSAVDDNDSRISALEAATGFVSVSPQAFHDKDGSQDCRWRARPNFAYGYYVAGGDDDNCTAVTAIHLPHGATITSIACYVHDNDGDADSDMIVALWRNTFSGRDQIFTVQSIESVEVQVISDTTASTPERAIVDNQNAAYYIAVSFDDTDIVDSGLRLHGCTVGYQ